MEEFAVIDPPLPHTHTPRMSKRVPWANWAEWELVHSLLFSPDASKRVLGLKFVKAWQSRRQQVPVAVESTASFVELFLYDGDVYDRAAPSSLDSPATTPIMPVQFEGVSEYAQRLVWAMAICRFVNGIVDQAQNRLYAQSVQSLARRVGLTYDIVAVRHQATHQELPSLAALTRIAIKACASLSRALSCSLVLSRALSLSCSL